MKTFNEVLDFWFDEKIKEKWFVSSPQFDHEIEDKFLDTHKALSAGNNGGWESPKGRLAQVIVLDQFSRNIFRNSKKSFLFDPMAQKITLDLLSKEEDLKLTDTEKAFLYMPLMHSESLELHELAMEKFMQSGLENFLEFEKKHKAIIERFGRYPHRNIVMNRESTPQELEFLDTVGVGW